MRDCARSFVLLTAIAASTTPLIAQCANAWTSFGHLPGADGRVSSLVSWDPDGPGPAPARVALGGSFTAVGNVLAYRVATWDPAPATWSPIGAGIPFQQMSVNALLPLPNGELVAGGLCYPAGSTTTGEPLLRWDGSSWTPFGGLTASLGFGVRALARLPNGDLAVGGGFAAAGVPTLANVGIWNGVSWSSLGGGTDAPVHGLVVLPNGDLLAVGDFTVAGGVPANGVARWNGTTWSAVGGGVSGGTARVAAAVVLANGDLVVGGSFTHAGGVPASNLARWDGSTWSDIGGGISGTPYSGMGVFTLVGLPNGDLVVGGSFALAGGVPAANVARWNGGAWSAVGNPGTLGRVAALLVLPNGDLLAGGDFHVVGGVGATHVARWDGTAWSPIHVGEAPTSYLRSLLTMPDGAIVAGGMFQAAGGTIANGIARWDSGSWSTLGSPPGGGANAMTLRPNGDLVVGGGQFVGTWDGASWTALATSFAGAVPHADIVEAVAVLANGDIVIGGDFAQIGGNWIVGLARWDGVTWSRLGGQDIGEVHALAVLDDGDLVVGGDLWTMSPLTHGIARWNGSSWSTLGSGVQSWGASGEVFAIAPLPNGALIAGGQFTTAGGVPANNIARWDGIAWSPLGAGVSGRVRVVHVLPDGDVIAAGDFLQAGGVPVGGVARWNGSVWAPVAGSVAHARVFAITAEPNGDLLLGGDFAGAGGVLSPNLVRLTTSCPASAVTTGAGCAGDTVTASLPWTGSAWRADASGLPSTAAVLTVNGFAPTSLSLVAVFPTAIAGCTLHVSPDVVDLTFAANGAASFAFAVPNSPALAGVVFHHQMVSIALDATLAVTATNALQLTVGTF